MKTLLKTGKRPAVLWLVTACTDDEVVPQMNTRLLGGIPLLAWRILSAIACRSALSSLAGRRIQGAVASGRVLGGPFCGDSVWLYTNSTAYAETGRRYGAEVPFMRPTYLNTAPDEAVCLHALQVAEAAGLCFDMLGLLPSTAPFVRMESLRSAVSMLHAYPEALGAVAVRPVRLHSRFVQPESPWLDVLARRMAALPDTRTQNLPAEITPCGGFYLIRWQALQKERTLFTEKNLAVPLQHPENFEIRTEFDFDVAEMLLARGHVPHPVTTTA